MVIRVMVEGGVVSPDPTLNQAQNAMIQRNSAALRESLNDFFAEALGDEDLDIKVSVGGGYEYAARLFISQPEEDFLYVDLDDKPENRAAWFSKLLESSILFPAERKPAVFFWIPEMEAWFLKQPECFMEWANNNGVRAKVASPSDFECIEGKDIEHLQHKPSELVKIILAKYFVSNTLDKRGKPKKIEYGKLRHAPDIIRFLNPRKMIMQDNELAGFVSAVQGIQLSGEERDQSEL